MCCFIHRENILLPEVLAQYGMYYSHISHEWILFSDTWTKERLFHAHKSREDIHLLLWCNHELVVRAKTPN